MISTTVSRDPKRRGHRPIVKKKSLSITKHIRPASVRNSGRRIVNKLFDSTFLVMRQISDSTVVFRPNKRNNQIRELIGQLTELLASPSDVVRQSALQAYLRVPLATSEYQALAFSGLTVGLRDSEPRVRLCAVTVLGKLIEVYPDLWEYGIPLLNDCCHDSATAVAKKSQVIIQNQTSRRGRIQNTYLVK